MRQQGNPLWLKYLPDKAQALLEGRVSLLAAIRNSGWLLFDKILRALLVVLVGAWVARYLGPSQFGEFTYYIAFVGIFLSITNLGLDGIVVRDISNNLSRGNILLGTVFRLRLLVGLVTWVLALLIYGATNSFEGQGIWIVALVGTGMICQAADTVDLWFQGNSQSKRTVLAKMSAYLISNLMRVVLILLQAPLIAFAVVSALEGMLTAFALYISYKRFPCEGIWQRHYPIAKKLFQESWPYMVSGLSIMLYMRIDQIMIKSMLGNHELGIFAVIIPVSNLWNMIPGVICTSVAPFIARKKLEGDQAFNAILVKMFRFFWVMCLTLVAATFALSGLVIKLMYGPAYAEAIPVLNLYILTCIPIYMGIGQGLWLLNERKPYLALIQTTTGAIVSVVTNLILLPMWGIEGAAIAAVLSQLSSCFLVNSIFARELFWMQLGFNPAKAKK